MLEKSIIIIGAGVAGLAAGCYGQMNGYKTRIYEMHILPGGICTSWERRGYTIDGSLRWVLGVSPQSKVHRLWEELGVVQGQHFIFPDEVLRYENPAGKVFRLYADLAHLEEHMNEIAPEDREATTDFIQGLRECLPLEMSLEPVMVETGKNVKADSATLANLAALKKWSAIRVVDVANRFRNPLLREALQQVVHPDFPTVIMMSTIGMLVRRTAGYPVGGSLSFARSIEQRYLALGGKVKYNSRVTEVLVKDGQAVGVQLEDGSQQYADYVISAADGHATIFDLLGGRYLDDAIRSYYKELPLFSGLVHVAFGVNRTFPELPILAKGLVLEQSQPVTLANKEYRHLPVTVYNFDLTLAPYRKTVVKVMLESDIEYWSSLWKNIHLYDAEKERIADQVMALLERRFHGLAGQVEMWDVSTPLSFERYTGNWQGSYQGWLINNRTIGLRLPRKLPGLENFWMVGQWVEPGGGLPAVVRSGRQTIQDLCAQDGQQFQTSLP